MNAPNMVQFIQLKKGASDGSLSMKAVDKLTGQKNIQHSYRTGCLPGMRPHRYPKQTVQRLNSLHIGPDEKWIQRVNGHFACRLSTSMQRHCCRWTTWENVTLVWQHPVNSMQDADMRRALPPRILHSTMAAIQEGGFKLIQHLPYPSELACWVLTFLWFTAIKGRKKAYISSLT